MSAKHQSSQLQQRFMELMGEYDPLIYKVCYMYADDDEHLQDLHQEVLANIWSGMKSFAGKSKISTWIYRISLNTCITYFRRHGKHTSVERLNEKVYNLEAEESERMERLQLMYKLIGRLDHIDKAIVMLWLDEHSYEEISAIVGISRANVASRLHRAKQRLAESASHE